MNIKIYKRTKAIETRTKFLRLIISKHFVNRCFVIRDDEKYFSLSINTNIPDHVYYYTSDKSATSPNIKIQEKIEI